MSTEAVKRINDLREEMKKRGLDAALVFTSDEHGSEYIDKHYAFREYLSGFTGSAGSLLITMDEAGLWTDGRYFIQAANELKDSGICLHKMGEEGVKDIFAYTKDIAAGYAARGKKLNIGADLRLISAFSYGKLKDLIKRCGCIITDTDLAGAVWSTRPAENHTPVYMLPDSLTGCGISAKIKSIRDALEGLKADGVIISDLSDIMWIFNIRGNDILYNPVAVSYGYIDRDKACLFIYDGCVDDETAEALKEAGVTVSGYEGFDTFVISLKDKRILCDFKTLNAHVYELLKENEVNDSPSWKYVAKHIKNRAECDAARHWHEEDGLAVTKFICRIKKLVNKSSGTTIDEYTAAHMLDEMRYGINGNRGLSFETIAAYGSNGAIIHYTPDKDGALPLKNEGFLLVDSGGQYDGATTDITRTIALGPLTEEMKADYTTVLKGVLDLADAVFLEGTRGENLDILARRPIWERFLDYRHGTGHGVGAMLNVHEKPQAFRYRITGEGAQPRLAPGMITSDEPGIYIEGKYGIRIENLLLCIEKMTNEWGRFLGFETLTKVPYEREAVIAGMLTERQKEILNDYHKSVYALYAGKLEDEEREWLASVTAPV